MLGVGMFIDGNIGIGVLPERQEIFIPFASGGFAACHFLRPGDLQMCSVPAAVAMSAFWQMAEC